MAYYTMDREREFAEQLPDMLSDATLNAAIADADSATKVKALTALKDCATNILNPGVKL